MKSNNQKHQVFIFNYIWSPIIILIMTGVFFFKGGEISIQKIIDHKSDPKLYVAFALAILFLVLLRRGIRFPKNNQN